MQIFINGVDYIDKALWDMRKRTGNQKKYPILSIGQVARTCKEIQLSFVNGKPMSRVKG